jgi:VanZ family protein
MAFWLRTRSSRFKAALVATFICALYGLADEGIQYFIPSRNASLEDYAADVLGAIFGSICYLFLDKLLSMRDAQKPVDSPVK